MPVRQRLSSLADGPGHSVLVLAWFALPGSTARIGALLVSPMDLARPTLIVRAGPAFSLSDGGAPRC